MDYYYYDIWRLDVEPWFLTDEDKLKLDSAIWLVDNKASVRKTARNMGVSKSSLHRWLTNDLAKLSFELDRCVRRVLNSHMYNRY